MKARRYQLTKDAVAIIDRPGRARQGGHPWIFRDQLSTAAQVFRDGDLLRLVDGANKVIAYGTFEAEGAIAIRIVRRGPDKPDAAWLRATLDAAIAKRVPLAERTNAMRLVHGENDGIPAVVVDRYNDTVVVSSYAAGSDAYARFVGRALGRRAEFSNVLLESPQRRRGAVMPQRALAGTVPGVVHFDEDGLSFAVDLAAGQKTGTFLDLRGLRRAVATTDLAGKSVLNLFAYTGMLGRCAEAAGATRIVQVDRSQRALDFARAHHVIDPGKHDFVVEDIFERMPAGEFDLVIVDPPAMTSKKSQVPSALAAYRKLYGAARERVRPGGLLVAACCTSRIERAAFHDVVRHTTAFAMERELPVEVDHPVAFREADYLKIAWWRRPA
jgi:23S rRNA (cytosine1962-C5)-methyltransferase